MIQRRVVAVGWRACWLVMMLVCALPVRAQENPAEWIVKLDAGWKAQIGDDMAYAQPGFDDSAWRQIDLKNQLRDDSPARMGDRRWYRLHFRAPQPGPVNLLLDAQAGSMEIYVNGRRVSDPFRNQLTWTIAPGMVFPLRESGEVGSGEMVIAVRSRVLVNTSSRPDDLNSAFAGSPRAVAVQAQALTSTVIEGSIASMAIFALTFVLGLLLGMVFLQQREHREYLWLGVSLVCLGLSGGLLYTVDSGLLPMLVNFFIGDPATYFAVAAEVEFVYAFTRKTPGKRVRVYQTLLVLTPILMNPFIAKGLLPINTLDIVETSVTAPGIVLILVLVLTWYRRGSREAGVLVVPMALANLAMLSFDIEDGIRNFKPGFSVIPEFRWHGITITAWFVSQSLFLLSIGVVLFFRFSQASREQAQQQAELESARAVQHVMVPDELPLIRGLRIESAYKPAQEVGGDFFQIVPLKGEAGTLVVIGDVSGKGLPAALNVALIIGVLRTLAETTVSPATVLEGVNRALYGRSAGFTTCLAMRLDSDGRATVANAGHIAPYRGGLELAVANGLPLGLDPEAVYEETVVSLAAGETLTLMTDGVVEAQDPETRELFGFGRTAEISSQTAEQIAEAARNFGQSDDIAVLTLQYLPV